jgi:hypothetical protein
MPRMNARLVLPAAAALLACACASHPGAPAPGTRPVATDAPHAEPGGSSEPSDHAHPQFEVRERWGTRPVPPAPPAVEQMDLPFAGQSRAAAKTSIAAASVEEFATLDELLDSLPPDDVMAKHSIARDADRVPEESRNVRVREAWVYAARLDDDHDVRLIVGTNPRAVRRVYLVAVATALPPATSPAHERLRAVREDVFEALGHRMPVRTYGLLNPPARVQIEGSLLYEVERAPGTTAPQRFRPATAWEIHPITSLQEAP